MLCSLTITLGIIALPTSAPTTPTPLTITLNIDDNQQILTTYVSTVGDFLTEQNIKLETEDVISDSPDTALVTGMELYIERAGDIEIRINGESQILRTAFTNPQDILQQANITFTEQDRIFINDTEIQQEDLLFWSDTVETIEIKQAIGILIQNGNEEIPLMTTASTVGDVLFEENIILYLADIVEPSLDTLIAENLVIEIDRAMPIVIEADGTTLETRVQSETVGKALAEIGMPLMGFDYPIPNEDSLVTEDMTIQVVRSLEELEIVEQSVPFETVMQPNENLELDTRQVVQTGQNGTEQLTYRVRYDNGVEAERTLDSSAVTQTPVNQIIHYGTKIVLRTIDTPQGPREYWRKLPNMYATSYHPAALGGDDVTAIGMTLRKGIIASDPDVIRYRTEVFVPGYGVGLMADTGGPRSTPYWIDLGYGDANWVSWSKPVEVYLLTPIPERINYLLPAR